MSLVLIWLSIGFICSIIGCILDLLIWKQKLTVIDTFLLPTLMGPMSLIILVKVIYAAMKG